MISWRGIIIRQVPSDLGLVVGRESGSNRQRSAQLIAADQQLPGAGHKSEEVSQAVGTGGNHLRWHP